jgi:hypothetical protein
MQSSWGSCVEQKAIANPKRQSWLLTGYPTCSGETAAASGRYSPLSDRFVDELAGFANMNW